MGIRPLTVSSKDLAEHYPNIEVSSFIPTHYVRVLDAHTKNMLYDDYVSLGLPTDKGFRNGHVPGKMQPMYYVLTTGLWKSHGLHGIVLGEPVKFVSDYVQSAERDGFVYFIRAECGGPIKIGWSQNVDRRVSELQTGSAHKLVILGMLPGRKEDESKTHAKFAHLRMEGEWFVDAPEIREFLLRSVTTL